MIVTKLRKTILKTASYIALVAILFSCRGITIPKFFDYTNSSVSDGHLSCCDTFGENKSADIVHHNLMLGTMPQKNLVDISGFLKILFISLGLIAISVICKKNNFYVHSIRDRYGSFVFLNYFTNLFSQGRLNTKIF